MHVGIHLVSKLVFEKKVGIDQTRPETTRNKLDSMYTYQPWSSNRIDHNVEIEENKQLSVTNLISVFNLH